MTTVVSGGSFATPLDLAFTSTGRLLVLDPQDGGYQGALGSVDPEAPSPASTAVVTPLQGSPIARGLALALDRDGNAIVVGDALADANRRVWRVPLATGTATELGTASTRRSGSSSSPTRRRWR